MLHKTAALQLQALSLIMIVTVKNQDDTTSFHFW